jgi:hydrogenase maturation factor
MLKLVKKQRLSTGKVSKELLKRYVFNHLGSDSHRVLQGPHIGEDAAIIDLGDKVLVAKANPITGADSKIGWLAVHINANDVATRGAKPQWFMNIILLPDWSDESLLEIIAKEINEACNELGICVVGGHTEVVPGLKRPIVSGFMLGEADKLELVTTGGAKTGDDIILTKGAGIEGTGILAEDFKHVLSKKLSEDVLKNARRLLDEISIVNEALHVSKIGPNSMHTPTEGGILNGMIEISEAAHVGFKIYEDKIPITDETRQICKALHIDPLKLLSSGSLLIVSNPEKTNKIIRILSELKILAGVIGKITPESENRMIIHKDGVTRVVKTVKQDELYRILDEQKDH